MIYSQCTREGKWSEVKWSEVKWSERLYLERVAHLAKPIFHEALLKQHEHTNIHNIDYKGKQHVSE